MTRRSFLAATAASPLLHATTAYSRPLDDLRRKYRIPGLTAAVVHAGEVAWKEGFGYADVIRRTVAMPDTPYPIGGLTAAFTSLLAMKLIELGRLDLDEPVKTYIPMASVYYQELKVGAVKVRHLLTHTSDDVPPGETFRYNLKRFGAMTHVLAQLYGKQFEDLVVETFFDAIPMPDSAPRRDSADPRYSRVLGALAHPYRIDSRERMVTADFPGPEVDASHGLISTALDLARFDIALDEHRFVREETLRLARQPALSLTEKPLPASLGWLVSSYKGAAVDWLFDDTRGAFSALYIKVPSKRTSLILLANTDALSRPFPALAEAELESSEFARWFLDTL